MRLHCPSCSQPIVAEDVNVTGLVAKCRACDSVFRFESQLAAPEARSAAPAAPQKVPLPDGIAVTRDESIVPGDYRHTERRSGSLTIVRRWFQVRYVPLVPFCIAWDGFLVFWYSQAISGDAPWIMVVFPLAHVAIGVGLTYSTLAGLLNTTTVKVADGRMRVRHGPIPWRGNRDLDARAVRQLYTEEHRTTGKNVTARYAVHAIVDDGPTVPLVKNLESSRQALYIEQELEDHLGIADAVVPGALVRKAS